MNARDILKNKGPAVVTARQTETLQRIARLIAEHRIGAVLVVDSDTSPLGIVSERDIVNALAAFGAGVLEMPAERVMSRRMGPASGPAGRLCSSDIASAASGQLVVSSSAAGARTSQP